MTCANWGVTIFALIILALTIWPTLLSVVLTEWIIILSVLIIIVLVWVGCECKYCANMPKRKKR